MAIPNDVKSILLRVFQMCTTDPTKLTEVPPEYAGKRSERVFTVENLENLATNHLFDDHLRAYGITELEGCKIRHYFSVGAETYDFVLDLRKEFPDFFKHPESQEYLDSVNHSRRSRGLSAISL